MASHYIAIDGLHLIKSKLDKKTIETTKNQLMIAPYSLYGFIKKSPIYKETETELIIPKFFATYVSENRLQNIPAQIPFKGVLRDYQIDIVNKCVTHIKTKFGGILSLGCGRGKTVISLQIAALLGVKTLIVVHKQFLLEQWIDRIKTFTGIDAGIIKQNKIDIENKNIVVAMIKSISKRDYDVLDQFSFVIYDEAHHVPAKMFTVALQKTGSFYNLALTATPYRTDGLIKVMHWYVGNFIYKEDTRQNKCVMVKIINYKSTDEDFVEEKRIMIQRNERKIITDMTKTLDVVCKNKNRRKMICKIIKELIKIDNKILVLSKRIKHLKKMKSRVDKYINKKNINCKTFYYIGETKSHERVEAETYGDVLFGTFDMASEALDIPKLNTIILATSIKDAVQTIGRNQRSILKIGDVRPLIIDIVDNLPIFINHGKKREKLYQNCEYQIEKYICKDGIFNESLTNILHTTLINEQDLIVSKPKSIKFF